MRFRGGILAAALALGVATQVHALSPCAPLLAGPGSALSQWAAEQQNDRFAFGVLDWDMALELVQDLSPALREALFAVEDCVGNDCRYALEARIWAQEPGLLEAAPVQNILERMVINSWSSRGRPWPGIREEIAAAGKLPAADRMALRARAVLRQRVYRAQEAFSDAEDPYYRAVLDGDELIFPDGARRAVTRGLSGRRYIWIPYKDIIRTQEYSNSALVGYYIAESATGYRGFEAYLAPDGRAVIVDQHHRTEAYAKRQMKPGTDWEETLIPIRLERHRDGSIRTDTHWAILSASHQVPNVFHSLRWKQQKEWEFLPADEREKLLVAAGSREKISVIRRWYYESTGLKPLTTNDAKIGP